MFVSRWSRPYAAPQEALADFLAFARPARQQLEARPEWNEWLLSPDIINPLLRRGPGQWELEWREAVGSASPDFEKGLSALRDLKQRESIRLGLMDFGGFPILEEVMAQLSDLADFCLQKTLLLAQKNLGKKFGAPGTPFTAFITEPLPGGLLFPMNFRQRPHGDGPVCLPWRAYEDYYLNHAGFAEFQALNRARFVAGDVDLAGQFLDLANTVWQRAGADPTACEQIDRTRSRIEKEKTDPHFPLGAFKTGRGGVLDIEFGLQRFLITRGHREPSQRTALDWMKRVHPAEAETWRQGLEFLRKIEAALRRDSYTAVSTLPVAQDEQAQLAQRLGFLTALDLLGEYKEQTGRIRAVYEQLGAKPI